MRMTGSQESLDEDEGVSLEACYGPDQALNLAQCQHENDEVDSEHNS